jgi:excisionase family DNA binding protein
MSEHFMTVEQCAKQLGVSSDFIRRLIRDKQLPAYKVGKKEYRIRTEAWEKFLEERRTDKPEEK